MKGDDHKQYRCSFPGCDKVFNRRDYLERHATNHLSVKPFVCVLCNRHFSRKDLYDNHLTTKRHARVIREAEQATYAGSPEKFGQTQHIAKSFPGQAVHRLNSFNDMDRDLALNKAFMESDESKLSIYMPPRRQPAHLSGPGPGNMSSGVGDAANFKDFSSQSTELMNMPYSSERTPSLFSSVNSMTPSEYYQNSTYRYYSDPLNMEPGNSLGGQNMGEQRMDMNLPDPYSRSSASPTSINNQAKPVAPGKFSAYGLTLGLETSSSVRSDSILSEEFSSDGDGQSSKSFICERIRKDMAQNPHPFRNLRDNSAKTTDDLALQMEVDGDIAGVTLNRNQEHETSSNDDKKDSKSPADAVISAVCDERYAWFFDDVFDTKMAKLGYDRSYSDSVEVYHHRSKEFLASHPELITSNMPTERNLSAKSYLSSQRPPATNTDNTNAKNGQRSGSFSVSNSVPTLSDLLNRNNNILANHISVMRPLNQEGAAKVLAILRDVSPDTKLSAVDQWIQAAWIGADAVKYIVHPATFEPSGCHLSLLAVLALIGMSLSENKYITSCARKSYASVFIYTYESLVQLPAVLSPGRLDGFTVNKLQAISLLLRYERLILISDRQKFSFARDIPGKYVMDLFLSKALAAVPHVGDFSTSKKQQPIWATISGEGYMFHQGADPEAQWREWALIESTKRTVHFSLYCDSIVTLSTAKPNPVSIFNMDIHMVSPDPLWNATSAAHFFHVTGPTGIITTVPYLGLIKSLIRFPRVAQNEDLVSRPHNTPHIQAPWCIFALKSIAHGLIMIVGKLSGLTPHGDEMLKAVMQSRSDPNKSGNIFSKFDRQLQARLYRGLDIWYHYFCAAYGDVTDQILRISGSMSLNLRDDFDPPQSDDESEFPQYALIIVLCHYSSFIFVHEDLPIVLQVTANLKSWLETYESKSLPMLLDYLYMPLYTNWIRTEEAKGMVSASTLYIAWTHAVAGNLYTGNHMFLSAMIYISVIVVWLYDFASNDASQADLKPGMKPEDIKVSERSKVRLENYQFMEDAVDYIHAVYRHASGQGPPPKDRAINSVLLMAACLLHKRKSTKPLVEMILQLLSVMDPDSTNQVFVDVVNRSTQEYYERLAHHTEPLAKSQEEYDAEGYDDVISETSSVCASMGSDMASDLVLGEIDDQAAFSQGTIAF